MKVDSKEEILDHIYDHICKEFKWIVSDQTKELNSQGKEIIDGLGISMESNRVQSVINSGISENRKEIDAEI